MGSNKGNKKALAQKHVCSRINFLYQASILMAHCNNNTLAAYYGNLCRNVGTKALIHMSPSLKRTLCKLCSLPLLPGINTTFRSDGQNQQVPIPMECPKKANRKRRIRRLRKRDLQKNKAVNDHKEHVPQIEHESPANIDDHTSWLLECKMCGACRRFQVGTLNECWLERSEAVIQVLRLNNQIHSSVGIKRGESTREQ